MFFISDDLIVKAAKLESELNPIPVFNSKQYRVADSSLSYRQVNELGKGKLLDDRRETQRGWRSFSLKELAFCELVCRLKQFGLENTKLKSLHHAFFRPVPSLIPNLPKPTTTPADLALVLVFAGVKIVIGLLPDGTAEFYTPPYFDLVGEKYQTILFVNFNKVVGSVLARLGISDKLTYMTFFDLAEMNDSKKWDLSKSELELMRLVRSGEYERIEITFKDGKACVLRGTKVKRESFKPEDLAKMLKEKAYAKITIQMEDGHVVVHEIEEKQRA